MTPCNRRAASRFPRRLHPTRWTKMRHRTGSIDLYVAEIQKITHKNQQVAETAAEHPLLRCKK
jgi:hypothetical protein